MSDKIKNKIGEELYNKVLEAGLKAEDFDIVNDGGYIPRSRFNEVSQSNKTLKEEAETYKLKLTETSKMLEGKENLEKENTDLKTSIKDIQKSFEKKILNNQKQRLIENTLTTEGVKHVNLLMKEIDLEKITIENDNLLGFDTVLTGLKENYSDMFSTKQSNNNNNTGGQNNNNDSGDGDIDWTDAFKDL